LKNENLVIFCAIICFIPEEGDIQLITRYLKGDGKSLELLIERYFSPIYAFIYQYVGGAAEAEDITQEVFVKVWKNIKKFNPRRGYFGSRRRERQKSFRTWIFSIAKNASIDFLRKKKAIPFSDFSTLSEDNEEEGNEVVANLADPTPLPDEVFARKDLAEFINSSLKRLPPQYRTVLFLYYNLHFTFQEISDSLGESINTIKSRHRRALINLRKIISDNS